METFSQMYYYDLRKYVSNDDWNALINSSQNFKTVKYYSRHIILNRHFSNVYLISPEFKKMIDSKLGNISWQLSLNLDNYIIPDMDNYNNSSTLSSYVMLYSLSIRYSNINELSTLKYLKKLDLTGCHEITDLSPLKFIEEINLSHCTAITDLLPIKNVKKIILNHCQVSDLSVLIQIKYIYITNCNNITNVTSLKNVNTVHLIMCNNITTVKELNKVENLLIIECNNIKDIKDLLQTRKRHKQLLINNNNFFYDG